MTMLNGTYNTAPDTPSLVYPDRLIRPLPRRPIRSRLSIDAAESILYPPAPPATQLFYGSCTDGGDAVNESKVFVHTIDDDDHDQRDERDPHHAYDHAVEYESGDDDGPVVVRRSAGFRGSSMSPSASSTQPQGPRSVDGAPAKSSSTGPDGYDAFENTNNKKKRKIPTPGNLSGHPTLSPEFSNMGLATSIPTASAEGNHTGTYYGTGNPASPVGNGISGPGRGRLGRHVARGSNGRIPLTIPTPGPNARPEGIISAAIAAALSSDPRGPGGNVSVSLHEQQTSTPTKTQFTFTCESDSSKGMAQQPQNPYMTQHRSPTSPLSSAAPNQRAFSTQGTQTSPHVTAQMNQHGQAQQHQGPGGEPPGPGRKKKRSPGSIYALSARQRKIQQQYANLHHPPSMEDIWICEFCEYESIFGRPPEALIRQYEIKDRKERKRIAEKKRLLEKAKMKGRKGKKATKNASKHHGGHQGGYHQGYDRGSVDHSSVAGSGGNDDDYMGHEHDEEPLPAGPPASFKTPLPPGNPPKPVSNTVNTRDPLDGGLNRPP